MSDDSGFWVEFSSVAGGANEHGMNGWLELVEHWPDGRDVRREYVAKDSPLYAAPIADKLRIASAALEPFANFVTPAVKWMKDADVVSAGSPLARKQLTYGDCRRAAEALADLKAEGA